MKIISDKKCYIQGQDLDYLIDNHYHFPYSIYEDAINELNHHPKEDEFFRVTKEEAIVYLFNNPDILDFGELYKEDNSVLKRLILMLKEDIRKDCKNGEIENCDAKSLIEAYKIKNNKIYLLKQIREILLYKTKQSKVKYPFVSNPAILPIENDKIRIVHNIGINEYIIDKVNGKISQDDIDFCNEILSVLVGNVSILDDEFLQMITIEKNITKKLK